MQYWLGYAATIGELEKELARLRKELKVPDEIPPQWLGNQGAGGGKNKKKGCPKRKGNSVALFIFPATWETRWQSH